MKSIEKPKRLPLKEGEELFIEGLRYRVENSNCGCLNCAFTNSSRKAWVCWRTKCGGWAEGTHLIFKRVERIEKKQKP